MNFDEVNVLHCPGGVTGGRSFDEDTMKFLFSIKIEWHSSGF